MCLLFTCSNVFALSTSATCSSSLILKSRRKSKSCNVVNEPQRGTVRPTDGRHLSSLVMAEPLIIQIKPYTVNQSNIQKLCLCQLHAFLLPWISLSFLFLQFSEGRRWLNETSLLDSSKVFRTALETLITPSGQRDEGDYCKHTSYFNRCC